MNGSPAHAQYKWTVTGLLIGGGAFNIEARLVLFAVVPLLRRDLGISDVQTGALMSLFLWTYAACSPLAGYVGDLLPRRRVLIGSLVGSSGVTLLAALAASTGQILATRVLLGLAQAFYIPVSMAILADYHPRASRGRAVALLTAGTSLGPILGGVAAGWVGDRYGWRLALIGFAVAGLLYSLALYRLLRDVAPGASDASDSAAAPAARPSLLAALRHLVGIPSFLCLGLVSGVTSLAVWMLNTWLAVFLFETFRMTLAQSGFLGNLAVTGAAMVGALGGGLVSDLLARTDPARRMLLFAVFLSVAAPFPLLFRTAGSAAVVLGAVAGFMLFRSLGETNWHPVMFELVRADVRSTATGVTNAFNCVMGGAGALAAGYYKASLGFQAVFGLVSVAIALAAGVLFLAYFVFLEGDLARAGAKAALAAVEAENRRARVQRESST